MILASSIPIRGGFSDGGRGPFSNTINGQDGCFVVGRTEKSAGGMAQMVLCEKQFLQRLLIKDHVVQVAARKPGLAQAKIDGLTWEAVVMLYSGKAFFLRSSH